REPPCEWPEVILNPAASHTCRHPACPGHPGILAQCLPTKPIGAAKFLSTIRIKEPGRVVTPVLIRVQGNNRRAAAYSIRRIRCHPLREPRIEVARPEVVEPGLRIELLGGEEVVRRQRRRALLQPHLAEREVVEGAHQLARADEDTLELVAPGATA